MEIFQEQAFEEVNLFLEKKGHDKKEFLNHFFSKYSSPISIPADYKGKGGTLLDIFYFNKNLVLKTGDLGFSINVLINQIILKFIDIYGSKGQKEKYFKQALENGSIFCLAVSEPDAGPHPKFLTTSAELTKDLFSLKGTKTYITNGSCADYSIVIAITKEDSKKYYSALIVDMNSESIETEEIKNLPFFKNSIHGTISFKNTPVPLNDILGESDKAYDKIVLNFRKYEDILMSGPVIGGAEFILDSIMKNTLKKDDKDFLLKSGRLYMKIKSLDYMCKRACIELEEKNSITEYLHLFFREEMKTLIEGFQNLCKEFHVNLNKKEAEILHDLISSSSIASKAVDGKIIKIIRKMEH